MYNNQRNCLLDNQNGSVLILTLIASALMGVAVLAVQFQVASTEKALTRARVKSFFNITEVKIKSMLNDIHMYTCQPGANHASSCKLTNGSTSNITLLQERTTTVVPGCLTKTAGSSQNCEVMVDNINFSNLVFTGDIVYVGEEFSYKPVHLEIHLSEDIFQEVTNGKFSCPRGFLWNGFDAKGDIRCIPISTEMTCLGSGKYISGVDHSNFKVTCGDIGTTQLVCDKKSYMTTFIWNGPTQSSVSCTQRKLDAFALWPPIN